MKARDILLDDETLFKDEEVFTPSYVPEDFLHRDSQIKEITLSLKPGLRGVNPVNTLVHGPCGTGKTTAIKYIFNEVNQASSKLVTVYVNCEDHNTRFGIFSKIHEILFGVSPPDTGKPLNAVKEKVFRKLSKENKSLVVALDEIDQLFLNQTVDKLLMDLLKAHTTYGYDRVGVVGILVDRSVMADLDQKAKSVFNPIEVFFPPYSLSEVEDILATRVRYGLYDSVLSKKLFAEIASKTYDVGDLRFGIDLIRRSALFAEQDSVRKIDSEHVEKAFGTSKDKKFEQILNSLDASERKFMEILVGTGPVRSGDLYVKYREKTGSGVKKYNQLISKLEHVGLIETMPLPGRGQSREIKTRYDLDNVREILGL
ncbi:MAG: ORC1-type DNA replication protein [Candidatus Altiarchaeota archaeon]|nr:ORC1-type DNA replication protein [Candidatus Altiarchaeota archaeon]